MEACWAHNPEVRGSKPRSAKFVLFVMSGLYWFYTRLYKLHYDKLKCVASALVKLKMIILQQQSAESRVAQWKRAGPITQRSVDRNHALLNFFFLMSGLNWYFSRSFFKHQNLYRFLDNIKVCNVFPFNQTLSYLRVICNWHATVITMLDRVLYTLQSIASASFKTQIRSGFNSNLWKAEWANGSMWCP